MEPARIYEMATGNWLSRALSVALRAGVFANAADGLSLDDVSKLLHASQRGARMMTDVLVAAGLLERDHEVFRTTPLSDAYLVPGRPHYLGDLVHMLDDRLYRSWARLEEALRGDGPVVATYLDAPPPPEEVDRIVREAIQGLHGLTTIAAEAMLGHVDLTMAKRHLDLGGGSGAMAITLARHLPDLDITVVDRAPILRVIEENATAAQVEHRIRRLERDFFEDDLPGGADVVTISNILHDWSRQQGAALIRRAHQSLRPGGRLIVNEWLIDDDRAGPLLSALMSLCMLIETTAGENLTGQEVADLMSGAGFDDIQIIPTSFPHGVVTGTRPH